ncbi:MAG: phosphatase PAP2 family protein [Candidatus Rokuibacteriota bacterium]
MTAVHARALLTAAGGAFVALAAGAALADALPLDATVRQTLLEWATPSVLSVMRMVNYAGEWPVLVPGALLLLLVLARARARWWVWLGFMVAAPLLEGAAKPLIGRLRPEGEAFGFPSGHATAAAAVFGAVVYLAEALPPGPRIAVRLAGLAMILLVATARVMLGAHWPSDVVAGVALGFALASAAALAAPAQPSLSRER